MRGSQRLKRQASRTADAKAEQVKRYVDYYLYVFLSQTDDGKAIMKAAQDFALDILINGRPEPTNLAQTKEIG